LGVFTKLVDVISSRIEKKMKVYKKGLVPAGLDSQYIGRGSAWGNPFVIGKHGSRVEVIAQFRAYAEKRIQAEPEWLSPLKNKEALVCFCAPLACHGEVLISLM
jgi:hypothetical protein